MGLNYDECYWESESDISSFQQQIENFNRLQSRYRKLRKQKSNTRDATDSKKKLKDFQQFEKSPEFLPGGIQYLFWFGDSIVLCQNNVVRSCLFTS